MLYFLVRVAVYMLALLLTLTLLPGLHVNINLLADMSPSEFAQLTPDDQAIVQVILPWIGVLVLFVLSLGFWFWNWLMWPVILFFTGRLVLWSFGLLMIAVNALLFYVAVLSASGPGIYADDPAILWCVLGGLSMAFWSVFLEGITGLDSPLHTRSQSRHRYWQILNKVTFGGRNYFAENLRIAQSLEIITMYLKDIAFDNSPFGPIRRFFQRIIYWFKKPLIGESTAETVRYMLQELGPTYVKLGQIVSSRADQLPPEWREQMAKLQSNVAPFSYDVAEKIVMRELGAPIEELYTTFNKEPLAAASTAQVHRATLPDGQEVVVKVQRPDIDITVRADLNVVRDLTRDLEKRFTWARNSDIYAITDEYADNILREIDYTNEAFNGRMLAKNMEVFPEVHVPAIYPELSTGRVMTQEFIRGVKITNVEALDAAGVDRTLLATIFMRAIVKQVLYDGFFHGDPHPGNVLVDTNTSQIIFLDLGMVGTLTSNQRMAMVDLLWALSSGDRREIAKTVLGLTTSFKDVDEEAFIADVDRLLTRYTTFSESGMSLSGAMKALLDAMYGAGLRMDPQFTLALKAMIQAEETVRTLDPTLPLIDTAFSATKELLVDTFDADKVIEALRLQMLRGAKEAIRNIPSIEEIFNSWLAQLRKGKLTVYVDTSDVSKQISELDDTLTLNIRRLSLALLLVGLLIGASIASNTPADLLPDMAELAYLIFICAAGLTVIVLIKAIVDWLNGKKL
ncbi:MAG: AarF/UbiB family protein [Caldilineaceae bacterium]